MRRWAFLCIILAWYAGFLLGQLGKAYDIERHLAASEVVNVGTLSYKCEHYYRDAR
jgi:hypothetical protein